MEGEKEQWLQGSRFDLPLLGAYGMRTRDVSNLSGLEMY